MVLTPWHWCPAGANGQARGRIYGIALHCQAGPYHALHRHPEAGTQHSGHHSADVQDLGLAVPIHSLLSICHVPSSKNPNGGVPDMHWLGRLECMLPVSPWLLTLAYRHAHKG